MKISYFKHGVSNTTTFKLINWKRLYKLLQTPSNTLPTPVGSPQWEVAKKRSEYIVRGKLDGPRADENLMYGCVIILDGDKGKYGITLSTPKEVHKVMKRYAHIVTTTPTPGRWRLIVPVKKYHPAMTDMITAQLYEYLVDNGICVEYAGESKVNSQPWFIRAVTAGAKYKVYGSVNGKRWKITSVLPKNEKFVSRPIRTGSRLKVFIDELKSGTVHQAAKSYIGWQVRTTNLTLGQIFEDVGVLIDAHCSNKSKVDRWFTHERDELLAWYQNQNYVLPDIDADVVFVAPISDAIHYGPQKEPYLDIAIQQPPDMFGRVVRALIDKQQAVYNPDMAFWIGLVLVDYLAGCGYASVLSKRCDPIYCFTSGSASLGKTATIQAARMYIDEIVNTEEFTADIANKRLITRAGSAEGVYDLVTGQLQDGCDILFVQDEFGTVAKSRSDNQGASFQEMFLYLATLSRNETVEARLLATANKKLKEYARRRDVYCCHFNYFTTTTNQTLKGILSEKDYGTGLLQRFIGGIGRSEHFNSKVSVYGHVEGVADFDGDVVETLGLLLAYSSSIIGKQRINAPLNVRVERRAKRYHEEISRHCITLDDVRYNKIAEKMLPVARVRALVENPENPVVTRDHMFWAHCIVLCSIQYFDWLVNDVKRVTPSGFSHFCKKVLNWLNEHEITTRKKALPLRDIRVRKPANTAATLTDALTYLMHDGYVQCVEIKAKNGQMVRRWYAVKESSDNRIESDS